MAAQQPRRKRADILKEALAVSDGSVVDVQRIAESVNLMKGRYMARPAAELLVESGDADAALIAQGLAATPVLGRDPNGDQLRAAFKKAMAHEGIPPDADEMARRFYGQRGHSGHKHQGAAATPKVDSSGWDTTGSSDTGGITGMIRRLFGGR